MFLITADVEETMSKILPIKQNLFPVSLKRKLEYEGRYMQEVIDKGKTEIWHRYLKQTNPLFEDVDMDADLIDEFCESIRQLSDKMERTAPKMTTPEDEIEKETIEEIPLAKQYDTLMQDKYENDLQDNSIVTKFAEQVIQFETRNNIPLEDEFELSEESENEDDFTDELSDEDPIPIKRRKVEDISVAPAEKGSFRNWNENMYIEELAFPHLYPQVSILHCQSSIQARVET